MDKGGVQFYFDDKVVLHNSGAVLGGRESMRGIGERKEGCGKEGRGRRVWMRKEETRGGDGWGKRRGGEKGEKTGKKERTVWTDLPSLIS